jgi:hypothetical protein
MYSTVSLINHCDISVIDVSLFLVILIYLFRGVEPIWLEKGLFWLETQQDGGKQRQIFTPLSAFSAIVGVSLKFVRFGNLIISYDNVCLF